MGRSGGGEVAQDGCGAEGGAHGNRKHRPLSVSPRLELASLKIHFHFQNETSRAGSEPLVPGVSPALRDGDAYAQWNGEAGACWVLSLCSWRVCLLCLGFPSGAAVLLSLRRWVLGCESAAAGAAMGAQAGV